VVPEILGFICSDDVYAGSKTTSSARSTGSIEAPPSSTITFFCVRNERAA